MIGKSINFDDEKINKSKKLFKIDEIDVDKIKNDMVQKIHLNTSLDIMMMMSLDHYV